MLEHTLSPQQLEVIAALSDGATITAAAEQAGIHRNTIANWRRNQIPFQHALSHAQYDRAMLAREKTEALVDLAVKTIHDILADPNAPASVRLKAALAIIQTAVTPPEPKKQIILEIENFQLATNTEPESKPKPIVHKVAQTTPPPMPKPAQAIRPVTSKIGRNELCPCGSKLKFKRCCLNKSHQPAAA